MGKWWCFLIVLVALATQVHSTPPAPAPADPAAAAPAAPAAPPAAEAAAAPAPEAAAAAPAAAPAAAAAAPATPAVPPLVPATIVPSDPSAKQAEDAAKKADDVISSTEALAASLPDLPAEARTAELPNAIAAKLVSPLPPAIVPLDPSILRPPPITADMQAAASRYTTIHPLTSPKYDSLGGDTLNAEITEAEGVMDRMRNELAAQKEWIKNTYEIIANYQYKYSTGLQKLKTHATQMRKLKDLIGVLKQARIHSEVAETFAKGLQQLGDLSAGGGDAGKKYNEIAKAIGESKAELDDMNAVQNEGVVGAQNAAFSGDLDDLPPSSNDAMTSLAGTPDDVAPPAAGAAGAEGGAPADGAAPADAAAAGAAAPPADAAAPPA